MKPEWILTLALLCTVGCSRSDQDGDAAPHPESAVTAEVSTAVPPAGTPVETTEGTAESMETIENVGAAEDPKTTFAWYRRHAMQGAPRAQGELGRLYEEGGAGVERDYRMAMMWYRRAAAQGDRNSQYSLACMYHEGRGAEVDVAAAADLYRQAAVQGHAGAQVELGLLYLNGEGIDADYAEARKWLQMAADLGNPYGQSALGDIYAGGFGVEHDAQRAVQLYTAAALQGLAEAQLNLGNMYGDGAGVQADYLEAVRWFAAAAEQGNADAQYNLGVMQARGMGTAVKHQEAAKWYKQAAEQGSVEAMHNLASLYGRGAGVPQDYDQALYWFTEAYDNGFTSASYGLATTHLLTGDFEKAAEWFEISTEEGDHEAPKKLGDMYSQGIGVEVDLAKASESYRIAVERGSLRALKMLRALADNGSVEAQTAMGMLFAPSMPADGSGSADDVSAVDTGSALYWLVRAEQKGSEDASRELEKLIAAGLTTPEAFEALDQRLATVTDLRVHLQAIGQPDAIAKYGEVGAMGYVAGLHATNAETEQDKAEVLKWCQAAAENDYVAIYNNIAWQSATSQNPEKHNPGLAVQCAIKAIELQPDKWYVMDTVAAAYASAGEFEQAVEWQKQAITVQELAGRADDDVTVELNTRLKAYEKKKRWSAPPISRPQWPVAPRAPL